MIIQLLSAMIGTIAFSILFSAPQDCLLLCGLTGATSWGIYLLVDQRYSAVLAVLAGTIVIAFLSRFLAVIKRVPATVFLNAGIITLVPGAGIYWTTHYLITDQVAAAWVFGYNAVKTAMAIVLGLVLVMEIPQSFFLKLGKLFSKRKKGE